MHCTVLSHSAVLVSAGQTCGLAWRTATQTAEFERAGFKGGQLLSCAFLYPLDLPVERSA